MWLDTFFFSFALKFKTCLANLIFAVCSPPDVQKCRGLSRSMGSLNLCAEGAILNAEIWPVSVMNLASISLENTCNVGLANVVFNVK